MTDNCNFYIKEYCKICYLKKKYNLLKLENNVKKCESTSCNSSSPYYANAKNPEEFVRDFQNNLDNATTTVSKCKLNDCKGCSFAHNDFEYYIWNFMRNKDKRMYKISQLYKELIEPFIYIRKTENISIPQIIPVPQQDFTNQNKINQVPQSKMENEIIHKEENNKRYLCWFCLKEVTSENNIPAHIDSNGHKAYYEADKKRQWYFQMPISQTMLRKSDDNQDGPSQMEDEYLEMKARVKFRDFISSYTCQRSEKKIYPWPTWMELKMPIFPNNIKCYKNPIQLITKLSISWKCQNLFIYLRDDESRPFFKLIKTNQNQILEHRGQLLTTSLNNSQLPFEFGIEFSPTYSSTYRQRIEFEVETDKGVFTFCKSIRVDVGSNEHLQQFKNSWEKFSDVITQEIQFTNFVPFNNIAFQYSRGIMTEELLETAFKVIANRNWIDTAVESYNYCNWMRDMMVLEELEQRIILSKLTFHGKIAIQNSITHYNGLIPANDGKLFGFVEFQPCHNQDAREIVLKSVSNCYVVFDHFKFFFECELVDLYRYDYESRSIEGVTICFSKQTVETIDLNKLKEVKAKIYFCYDRLLFDRRHKSIKNMPKYDKLSYNPLVSPFFTRLPYGDDESKIKFHPKNNLNEEQKKLPKLVLRKLDSAEIALPFILNGAFGTGKTLVFAETVMAILQVDTNPSILICTRSYSAGDLYWEIFNKYIPDFNKIKLIKSSHLKKKDKPDPKKTIYSDELSEEIFSKNQVFITTIENAVDALSSFRHTLKNLSMFKYIFVDEAAQVLEVDAIMVYQFGNDKTKFIFAGDIFQTRPELFNKKLKKFSVPIICRLYNIYKSLKNYTICLKEVYRTHPRIVEYLSAAIYYETPLISLMSPMFEKLIPMEFYDSSSTLADKIQIFDTDLCSFKNVLEIEILVQKIKELTKNPNINIDIKKILVCSPFYAQVKLIRDSLRSHKLGDVIVDMPLNIQGREFDVVFISTVLTKDGDFGIPILHPTFHSNRNLINLVISRTKHFVGVVGDRNSLTTDNPTRRQWIKFIEMCDQFVQRNLE